MRPRLYIMAKAPIMGHAKTRLAADIGRVHAKRHYRAMMGTLLCHMRDPRWNTVLMITPTHRLGQVPDWDGFVQIPQVRGSLSPKLAQVFSHHGPTIVIGTDSPQIRAGDIAAGFKALRRHEAVFGPASDGGFWLMGAKGPLPEAVFENVRWSSQHTLSDMEAHFGRAARLRTLTDIDDKAALNSYQRSWYRSLYSPAQQS